MANGNWQVWQVKAKSGHRQIIFSHEVHFWKDRYVNKQNCQNKDDTERPMYPEKSLSGVDFGLVGSSVHISLRTTLTMTSRSTANFKDHFIWPKRDHVDTNGMQCQQNGSFCCLISHEVDGNCKPRWYDLTSLEFFFWCFLKSLFYDNMPQRLQRQRKLCHKKIKKIRCVPPSEATMHIWEIYSIH